MKNIVDFLFEAGFLKKLKRSGYAYLGSGDESVADHTCRTLFIAYVLGQMTEAVGTAWIGTSPMPTLPSKCQDGV